MQQLEIQYFFPLTEQIRLDLDYTPCEEYAKKQQEEWAKNSISLTAGQALWAFNGGTVTLSNNLGNPSFTINVDQTPITIVSKKKPNFVKKFIYKTLGMKWKSE